MANNDNFEVGDVVKLKSGSPKMTIVSAGNGDNECLCKWYDNSDFQIRSEYFPPAALEKYQSPQRY